MGFLRMYLALCVIAAHSSGILFGYEHRGDQAVQIFFAISGFYMAMVLSETYKSKKHFLISRAIRIYVPYFAILLAICLLSLASGLAFSHWLAFEPYMQSPLGQNGLAGIIFTAATNMTIFFQDLVMFLQQDVGEKLHFTPDFSEGKSMLWHYLIISQSWSVALELYFYSLAPFLNAVKTNGLILIIAASTGLRCFFYNHLGLNFDPWTYRFFPCELSTFLIGMLAYRVYNHFRKNGALPTVRLPVWLSYLAILGALLVYAWTTKQAEKVGVISYLGYFLLILALPLLFHHFKDSKLDRAIGELSYPTYLLHGALVPIVLAAFSAMGLNKHFWGLAVAITSIGGAFLVVKLLIEPLEQLRKQFKN